jgi:hypothetical protein
MTTILILVLLGVSLFSLMLFQGSRLRNMLKHDSVLFSFQEARADVVLSLADAAQDPSISKHDLIALRDLFRQSEMAIANFDKLKVEVFTLNHFINVISNVRISSEGLKSIATDHRIVQEQKIRFGTRLFNAFGVYVPFLRFRLLVKILGFFTKILIRRRIDKITSGYRMYRDLESNYNNDLSHC